MKFIFLLLFSFLFMLSVKAQSDTIILQNNDIIIGDIKMMDKGVLVIETAYSSDDFRIKWKQINYLRSQTRFIITLRDGSRLSSTINMKSNQEKIAKLHTEGKHSEIHFDQIVYVKELNSNFIDRLNGDLAVGYNYTKSNSVFQFSFIGNFDYAVDKWTLGGSLNSVLNNQSNGQRYARTNASVSGRYFLVKDWFTFVQSDFLANDEQKLKLRTNLKGGVGNYFVRTNAMYFGGGLGLAYNIERYTDALEPNQKSLESFFVLEGNVFDVGDLDISAAFTGYPSITEEGRFRSDFSVNLKYSLPYNFFIRLGYINNFDNSPIQDASRVDYIIQTTFGWDPS